MAWRIEFAEAAERDFALIIDFLAKSYRDFGEDAEEAIDHAAERLRTILADAERLAKAPHRGTRHDDLLPGLRHVTIGRAVFWFTLDESEAVIRVLAVFFGGQDHQRHMLVRLLEMPRKEAK